MPARKKQSSQPGPGIAATTGPDCSFHTPEPTETFTHMDHTEHHNQITPTHSPAPFTFVNLIEDLSAKRIKDPRHRRIIRSHVMRNVRAKELAIGYRRPTGRAMTRKQTQSDDATEDSRSTPSSSGTLSVQLSPTELRGDELPWLDWARLAFAPDLPDPRLSPELQYLDPFGTLPGENVHMLMNYFYTVFIPMTFPTETRHSNWVKSRYGQLIEKAVSGSATFFAYMVTTAAHRATVQGLHTDFTPSNVDGTDASANVDFFTMKDATLKAIREKIERREFDDGDVIAAQFGLVGAALIVGSFEEARLHLTAIKMCPVPPGQHSGEDQTLMFMSLTDVRAALGMLQPPILALPWQPKPIDKEVLDHILPSACSHISQSGTAFQHISLISAELRLLLRHLSLICSFHDFNERDPLGLTLEEHTIFRRTAHEIEYSLLTYAYEIFPSQPDQTNELQMPPLEAIARLGGLSFLARIVTVTSPSSGVGRKLASHQTKAVKRWSKSPTALNADAWTLELAAWMLFLSIEGAEEQSQVEYFVETLAHVVVARGWTAWDDVAAAMLRFLYLPVTQEIPWRQIWTDVQAKIRVPVTFAMKQRL